MSHYAIKESDMNHEYYALMMAEAAQDQAYLNRTLDIQSAFDSVDDEISGSW